MCRWASTGEEVEGPCAGEHPWEGEGPCAGGHPWEGEEGPRAGRHWPGQGAHPHRRWHREGSQTGGRAQHCQKQSRQACGPRGRSGSMEVLGKWPPGPDGAKREQIGLPRVTEVRTDT